VVWPRVSARRRPVNCASRCAVGMSSGEKEGTKSKTTWQHGFIMTGHNRIDQRSVTWVKATYTVVPPFVQL